MVSITLSLYLANTSVSIHVSEMIGDMLTISSGTLKDKLPDCKDGEDVTITVAGKLSVTPDGAMMHFDPTSVEKAYPETGDTPAPEDATMSAGAAAIMGRGK